MFQCAQRSVTYFLVVAVIDCPSQFLQYGWGDDQLNILQPLLSDLKRANYIGILKRLIE